MIKQLFCALALASTLVVSAQILADSTSTQKPINAVSSKHAVGMQAVDGLGNGLAYRYQAFPKFGLQVNYSPYGFWGDENKLKWHNLGLAFLYTPYKGNRMSYSLLQTNELELLSINDQTTQNMYRVGLGALAEFRLVDEVRVGAYFIGDYHAYKKQMEVGLGFSLMYGF